MQACGFPTVQCSPGSQNVSCLEGLEWSAAQCVSKRWSHNEDFDETYYGFENHQGRSFLSDDQKPLGQVVYGNGNNEEKVGEGVHYKNVFGSYFHGPILSRNANLAYRLVTTALKKKYGQDIQLPAYEDILSQEIAEEYSDVKSKADFS